MKSLSSILPVALFCLAWSSTAVGEEDTTEKARARFFQGVELYKEASFEAALAEFKQAYQLSPSYRVLYNIAQTYFELRDYANAFLALKEYVEQGGGELSPARRAQVDELNHKLEKRVAYLDVTCTLDDADLRVDDISVGRSPLTTPILVNAGPRRISAVKPGHPTAARMVTAAGGDKVSVKLEMAPELEGASGNKAGSANSAAVGAVKGLPTAVVESEPGPSRARDGLVASVVVAGSCAVVAGVFGGLLLTAKRDFDAEVSKTPYDRGKAESLRSTALTYEYLADGFAAAALVSGGIATYLAITSKSDTQRKRSKQSVAVSPTVGGVLVRGSW